MSWLSRIQDRPDEIRCQPRNPQHLTNPPHLEFESARQFAGIGCFARIEHPLLVEGFAQRLNRTKVRRGLDGVPWAG